MEAGGWSSDEARGCQQKKTLRSGHSWGRRPQWGAPVTAIDQMARVYRWACSEKRRTLEDLLRLAERLRADIGRLTGSSAGASG